MADTFRLRGVDIHRVVRCATVGGTVEARPRRGARDPVVLLDELTRRLSQCDDYDEATRAALHALEDVFELRHTILLVCDPGGDRLYAVAENGYREPAAGAEVPLGEGVIGTAAASARVVCIPNLARARVMQAAVRAGESPEDEVPLPGLPGALSVAAVPLAAHGCVTGVLYLESEQVGAFGPHNERLLSVVGRYLAAALRGFDHEPEGRAPVMAAATAQTGRTLNVTYYQADDSVFVDDRYVIKGVPGRILWKLLREHAAAGRETFTNRELRLDETLGLPAGADNLEARLLVLRKRLAGDDFGLQLERVARGQLALRTTRRLALSEVETRGPMRAAHPPRSE
jgi:adenylate cyclase